MINRQTFCLHLSHCGGIVTVVGMRDAEASGWRGQCIKKVFACLRLDYMYQGGFRLILACVGLLTLMKRGHLQAGG